MGINDKNYCGEPVLSYKKPNAGNTFPVETPQESDEFNSSTLGLQWQWHANPGQAWAFPSVNGYLRMYGQYYPDRYVNMWNIPNLLLQKIPAPAFTATVKLSAALLNDGDKAGFIVMGRDYSYISLEKRNGKYLLKQMICNDAEQNNAEKNIWQTEVSKIKINEKFNYKTPVPEAVIYFRLKVRDGGICSFSYSTDGEHYDRLPQTFKAREGKWTGAKMGLFILNKTAGTSRSWADIDWFKVEK
jgi:beta-xylosidase